MKSAEQIEQALRRLDLQATAEDRERTLRDLVAAHAQYKGKKPALHDRHLGRRIMRQKSVKIAAAIAFALVLIGAIDLGTGAVAFSQARRAANSTLAYLRELITGTRVEEPRAALPVVDEETINPEHKAEISYAARFYWVLEDEQGVWQSLHEQGIEFLQASTAPEVYYAVLGREQATALDGFVTLRCFCSPHVIVLEGETAAFALTDAQPSEGRQGLALGLLSIVTSAGREIQSTLSFHDGQNGFEIPNVCTEPGGAVLIRAKGIAVDTKQGDGESAEVLIRVQVDMQ
jgi:hypothetical protein